MSMDIQENYADVAYISWTHWIVAVVKWFCLSNLIIKIQYCFEGFGCDSFNDRLDYDNINGNKYFMIMLS